MITKHEKAAMELFSVGEGERRERIEEVLERDGVTVDGVVAAANKMILENDVEGAAIGIAAINLTYPDHDADEYFEACNRILDKFCPLLRLQFEDGFPPQFESRASEMREIIFDAAERIAAGQTLGV
jgi:hypothetical protein